MRNVDWSPNQRVQWQVVRPDGSLAAPFYGTEDEVRTHVRLFMVGYSYRKAGQ